MLFSSSFMSVLCHSGGRAVHSSVMRSPAAALCSLEEYTSTQLLLCKQGPPLHSNKRLRQAAPMMEMYLLQKSYNARDLRALDTMNFKWS